MTTTQTINHEIGTIEFRISRRWWSEFMSDTITEEALDIENGSTDQMLHDTKTLIEAVRQGRRTKQERIADLDLMDLQTLIEHANWFAYFWGEEQAGMSTTLAEAGAWSAKGRGSARLAERAQEAFDALAEALGVAE